MKHATKGIAAHRVTSVSHRTNTSHKQLRPAALSVVTSHRKQSRRSHAATASFGFTKKSLLLALMIVFVAIGVVITSISLNAQGARSSFAQADSSAATVQTVETQAASRSYVRPVLATAGSWSLTDSSDSLDVAQLSVPMAQNPTVQAKIEQDFNEGISIPVGFNPNHATGDTGNAYPFSQCTWWAYIRRQQLGLPVGSHFGNGGQWANSARNLGYWVSDDPQVGDIMVFRPGQAGSNPSLGHVAIVEAVENGVVTTSESGAAYNGSHFSRQFSDIHDFQYIHF
jgi:surface antigen